MRPSLPLYPATTFTAVEKSGSRTQHVAAAQNGPIASNGKHPDGIAIQRQAGTKARRNIGTGAGTIPNNRGPIHSSTASIIDIDTRTSVILNHYSLKYGVGVTDQLQPYFFLEKGRILRATGADAGAVEAMLQRAVLDARSHHNRWFELQAVVELVELLQTVGRTSDARDMLDDLFRRLRQFSELQRTPVFRCAEILYATLAHGPE